MTPTDDAHTASGHIIADDLHRLALAEQSVSDPERAHFADCAECAGEYLALQQVVQLGRSGGPVRLLTPPGGVWASIHAELALSDAVLTPPAAPHPARTDAATGLAASAVDRAEPVTSAPVRRLPRRRWMPVAAAAGVIGLIGGIAIGVATTTGGAGQQVVAEATLDALPGWTASGSARVEQTDGGRRSVVVDVNAPPNASLREVWLLKADASGLVSLGLLDGSTGRFSIPAGVDLAQYPLVDVSAEPADGDPAHSGDSIVRGELQSGS